jgi:hypothetical protein
MIQFNQVIKMANRKTRRNEKQKYNLDYSKINDESSSNSIKIGVIVVVIFIAFYLLTMFLTNNVNLDNNNNDDTNTPASIQYDEILVGETFKMNDREYYVLMYDFSDTSSSIYETFISDYKANSTGVKLYTIDLAKGFNTAYISENSNPSTSNIDDLKVKALHLLRLVMVLMY